MRELKKYQEINVEKLLKRTKDFLIEDGNETIVFQSPTGSGKTFMATKYINSLIKEVQDDLCFLWVSIGKGELHKQSMKSVKREIDATIQCSVLEDDFFGSRTEINQNEIVFVNWEKIRSKDRQTGEWKNVAMQDKETNNFIEVLENTRNKERKIILIIDESHASATTERAKEIRDEIVKPELTIEMSATPVLTNSESLIQVDPNDVIEEGMIKKEVLINPNIDEIVDDEIDSQKLVIEAAIKKREELSKIYSKIDSKVNPLVLIQIPNSEVGEDKKNAIIELLRDKGITEEEGKVALWLSDEKINTESETLMAIDGKVEYLIFKQAIDTGWDCPRAQILVKFRETNSVTFEIQTVGRILRMPEAKHYLNEELNKAYVYTNIQSIIVEKEVYNPNIIKTLISKRKENYGNIKLTSYYKKRTDYGDITSSFYAVFEDEFCNYFEIEKDILPDYEQNIEKLKLKNVQANFDRMDSIIKDGKISSKDIDEYRDDLNADLLSVNYSENDLEAKFESIIKENLNGFAPKRSLSKVKQAIYYTFKKYFYISCSAGLAIYIQNLVVKNAEIFSIILDKATRAYQTVHEEDVRNKSEENINEEWEIPITKNFNPNTYEKHVFDISLYDPIYLFKDKNGHINQLELNFINYIDHHKDSVEWLWQNGKEHMETNFGIKKTDGYTFQPDFIVKFKDGRIGIFDTKAPGFNEEDNKEKAEALSKYLLEECTKGKNLIGGLVIQDGTHFKINMNENYSSFIDSPDEWDYFDTLF